MDGVFLETPFLLIQRTIDRVCSFRDFTFFLLLSPKPILSLQQNQMHICILIT